MEKISRFILEFQKGIMDSYKEIIAIIGGTGKEGKGLAYRWVKAGYEVIIGSRRIEKARSAANELAELVDKAHRGLLSGAENNDAARKGDIIVLTVPFEFHKSMLEQLKSFVQEKVVLDVTAPLVPPKVSVINIPENGSAAKNAHMILGENVKVISAFQNISFELLMSDDPIDCDVLVCGSNKTARKIGLRLVEDAGLQGWDAGPLENSIVAEGLTSILIRINKKYKCHSSGLRITGIER